MVVVWVAIGTWVVVVVLLLCVVGSGNESRREERRTEGELGRRSNDTHWWDE